MEVGLRTIILQQVLIVSAHDISSLAIITIIMIINIMIIIIIITELRFVATVTTGGHVKFVQAV